MLNKAQLIGNLGSDPKVKVTDGGQAVATFSVATNRRWKDRNDEIHEVTDWHHVVCWGRRAKLAEDYLRKGRLVLIEGRLQTTSWEDEETGATRYRTEIVCQNLQMLGRPKDEEASEPAVETEDEELAPEVEAPETDVPF